MLTHGPGFSARIDRATRLKLEELRELERRVFLRDQLKDGPKIINVKDMPSLGSVACDAIAEYFPKKKAELEVELSLTAAAAADCQNQMTFWP